MPRGRAPKYQSVSEIRSCTLAESYRLRFAKRKASLLRAVACELKTPAQAMSVLERLYARQTREYLRASGTTYGAWLERGPRGELEELREARRHDAVWDRIVDRFAPRDD